MATYAYDANNLRTRKTTSASTTHYVYGAGGLLYGEYDAGGNMIREYIYLHGQPLAQVDAGSPETITYLHTDHLGTPRKGSNQSGVSVWSWDSDAFGVGSPSGSRTVNPRMAGQYADDESGLFYNHNRYYNPSTGRYISSDPIGLGGGLNTFAYVSANPVMFVDPEGLTSVSVNSPADSPADLARFCYLNPLICSRAGPVGLAGVYLGCVGAGAEKLGQMIGRAILDNSEAGSTAATGAPMPDPDDDKPYKGKTPKDRPEDFRKDGKRQINKKDGSVWEKDHSRHGGSTWKRWKSVKDWEKGRKPQAIRDDGSVRK